MMPYDPKKHFVSAKMVREAAIPKFCKAKSRPQPISRMKPRTTSNASDSGYDSNENSQPNSPLAASPTFEVQHSIAASVRQFNELSISIPDALEKRFVQVPLFSWNVNAPEFVPRLREFARTKGTESKTTSSQIEATFTRIESTTVFLPIEDESEVLVASSAPGPGDSEVTKPHSREKSHDGNDELSGPSLLDEDAKSLVHESPGQAEVHQYDEKQDSGVELSSSSSNGESDESELLIVPAPDGLKKLIKPPIVPVAVPSPEVIENTELAVCREEYEATWLESTTVTIPTRKACVFGTCTSKCTASPCYSKDQMIDYRATKTYIDGRDKTTRIYLDIVGKAALISLLRSKSIRLLAQEARSIKTETVDIKDLDDGTAKYRFEIDISKFVQSKGVVVYSTSPIIGFFRDLEDEVDEFNPSDRPLQEIIAGRGTAIAVENLFLGTKEEFELHAELHEYSKDQRDVVTFCSECEDYLNQFDDFGFEAPPDLEENEKSDHTEVEWVVRNKTLKRYNNSRVFAYGDTMDDAKDVVILYCMENADRVCDDGEEIAMNYYQEHRTTQEEENMHSYAELSFTGAEMMQKTKSPEDKDRVVYRVVAWLSKDDGCYDPLDDPAFKCELEGCLSSAVDGENFLSATASSCYEELRLAAKNAKEDEKSLLQNQGTYAFTLVNFCEKNASDHKKHIYLDTASNEIEVHFSPCTQKLTISAPSITACHELDMAAIPPSLVGTTVHVPAITSLNCLIYSAHPIEKCVLDYTLAEGTDAPRGSSKELIKHLRAHCDEYKDFAPYAPNYKVMLGLVKAKEVHCEMKSLGVDEDGADSDEE